MRIEKPADRNCVFTVFHELSIAPVQILSATQWINKVESQSAFIKLPVPKPGKIDCFSRFFNLKDRHQQNESTLDLGIDFDRNRHWKFDHSAFQRDLRCPLGTRHDQTIPGRISSSERDRTSQMNSIRSGSCDAGRGLSFHKSLVCSKSKQFAAGPILLQRISLAPSLSHTNHSDS